MLADFFLNLPFPRLGGPYVAVSDVPCLGSTLVSRRPFDQMLSWSRPAAKVRNTIPRPNIEEQTLWPWTAEEELAFCRSAPPEGKPASQQTRQLPEGGTKPPLLGRKDVYDG